MNGHGTRPRGGGRVTRRTRLAALGVAVLSMLLSGCAGWGFTSSGGKTVTLTYALWDPNEQVGYQKSINLFEKMHPNIHVNIEQIPYGSYEQKITAEFITGQAPDLFWVNTPWLGTFIQDGMLTNLAPLIKRDHVNMAQYYPALVALHSKGSAVYGLPKDWDTIALYYNKSYFAKHHITIPANLSWRPGGGAPSSPS